MSLKVAARIIEGRRLGYDLNRYQRRSAWSPVAERFPANRLAAAYLNDGCPPLAAPGRRFKSTRPVSHRCRDAPETYEQARSTGAQRSITRLERHGPTSASG